jgi:hypothetical protein
MKVMALDEGLTLEGVLKEAAQGSVVLVASDGQARFAVLPTDGDETDLGEEIRALKSNPEFMAQLDTWSERARTGRHESLAQVRASYEALDKVPAILGNLTSQEADEILEKIGVRPADYGMQTSRDLIDHWKRCVEDLTDDR